MMWQKQYFLYADDLVLVGDDWKEVEGREVRHMEKGIRKQAVKSKS